MAIKKEVETGLTLKATADLGKALLEKAAEQNRQKLQQRVVDTLAGLLRQVEIQKRAMDFFEKQVAALKIGAFSFTNDGMLKYNDESLNSDSPLIVGCGQCGYDKIVIGKHR